MYLQLQNTPMGHPTQGKEKERDIWINNNNILHTSDTISYNPYEESSNRTQQ